MPPDRQGGPAIDTRHTGSAGRPGPGGRLRPARTAPLPLRARPVGGRGDDLGVVGGGDRLHGGRRRAASDRAEPARRLPGPAMDRHGLHADPGLADPAGRLAQRPLGAAAGVPGRAGLVHRGVGAVRGRARHRLAHRRAGRAGHRGRADDTGQPGHHRGGLPARRPHARDRDVGRIQRGVRRDRAFLGGWLLQAGSWRAIFLINVPVAAVTARVTRRHVPESRDTSLSGSADRLGALAGVAALAAATYAIIVLPGGGIRSPGFTAAAVLAVVSSAAFIVIERRGSHPMLPPAIFRPARFRAANAVTFVVNGALGGFAFVFIPALEIVAGYSPVVAGSALVPVTVVTLLLSGTSGRLAQRIGPRPQIVAGSLLCAVASMLAVRIGPHASYWTAVFPLALLFGLGLASLVPPLTASAMNSAPDSLAGLASGVNNAVARAAGLLWIAALPPITGLTGAAYTDPTQFRSSFAQISWICAAAFACAAVLAAAFITGPRRSTPAQRSALIQAPVPHLACPVAFRAGTSPTESPGSGDDLSPA